MIRVVVEFDFESEKKARAVYDALRPDDKPVPPHLRVESQVSGSTLTYTVEALDHRKIWSLRATVDEILAAARLAEEAVDAAGDR